MLQSIDTPLQLISHPYLTNLWVKRDDLIDPYISGNKWRKLKYVLEDAVSKKKRHLVTFGGAYSNHLVATAAAGAMFGLYTTAFVRGEEVQNEMLLLCRLYGMNLIFVERAAYKNKDDLYNNYFEGNDDTYYIPEGGASEEAVLGCAEIVDELPDDIDHLFCAAGTGTTAAGLLMGINRRKLRTMLHVIPVLKPGDFIYQEIKKSVTDVNRLTLHSEYHFGGYAKVDSMLLNFIRDFIKNTGILIDPVYTAKMFFAIDDLYHKEQVGRTQKIVAIHTGGLLGIFGMQEKMNSLFRD